MKGFSSNECCKVLWIVPWVNDCFSCKEKMNKHFWKKTVRRFWVNFFYICLVSSAVAVHWKVAFILVLYIYFLYHVYLLSHSRTRLVYIKGGFTHHGENLQGKHKNILIHFSSSPCLAKVAYFISKTWSPFISRLSDLICFSDTSTTATHSYQCISDDPAIYLDNFCCLGIIFFWFIFSGSRN